MHQMPHDGNCRAAAAQGRPGDALTEAAAFLRSGRGRVRSGRARISRVVPFEGDLPLAEERGLPGRFHLPGARQPAPQQFLSRRRLTLALEVERLDPGVRQEVLFFDGQGRLISREHDRGL